MAPQIKPELLEEWKEEGDLLVIWRCERCYKKTPFYKSGNPLIDTIYQLWVKNHRYCRACEKKRKKEKNPKPEQEIDTIRIEDLLEKYELPLEEEDYLWRLNTQKNL